MSERNKKAPMIKVELRFKDGQKLVLSKDRWQNIRGYRHPILVLGKHIDPRDIIGHDYYG